MKKRPLIPSNRHSKFTPEDDQFIRDSLARGDMQKTIAETLRRSIGSINRRVGRLGLTQSQRFFTAKEDAQLKELAKAGQSRTQIASTMNRPMTSIYNRAKRLGIRLKRKKSCLFYTEEQDQIMRRMWADGYACGAIAEQIGKTWHQVQWRAERLGLQRNLKPIRLKTKQAIAAQMKAPSVQKKKDPWTWPWERRVA